ncbi:MAG: hypothetical protein GOVbin703_29 [Prokaryotic dsDNA virus sp.]|nr:MAG: hypothetical protein GOVbin703_29 [Prokaryotic dsDNA virus sp.]|tara:strand:+ start:394 stop:663 length:270 start_codon:yes stop_codon:yes gene_type:complete
MKNEHELRLINESIKAYENTIKFLRRQILDLERKKLEVPEKCHECFTHKFKIATVAKKLVDTCEACECTPCDCDYGNSEEQMWKMWGDI